jgi:2-polyprenyl-3-methyl-5-hydroxy-6-metoxy-1,4-benzoquinol methylase
MKKCLLCGGVDNDTIYYFDKFDNKIVKCKCGFIYSSLETRKNVIDAYENDYWTNYQLNQGEKSIFDRIEEFEFISRERLDYIKEFKKQGRLLDVGCSMGFLVNEANKIGFTSVVIEVNKQCIDEGKKLYQGIDLFLTDLEKYNEEKFDVITSFNVIEHLDNPIQFLLECKKRLSDDGIIVIGTHDIESDTHKKMKSEWKQITVDGDHLYYFSIETMKKLADICGLDTFHTHKPIDPSFTIYLKNKL